MEGGAGVVDCFDSFVMSGGTEPGGLAVVSLEKDVGMLEDACVVETESSRVADVTDDTVEDV